MPQQHVASEPVAPATTKTPLIEPHLANNDPNSLGWSVEDANQLMTTDEPPSDDPADAEAKPTESKDAKTDVQTAPEEAATEPEAAPEEPKQTPSKLEEQFVELMSRDRELTKRERALRDKERDVEQRVTGMVSVEDLQKDPHATLAKAGISFQQLVDMQVNGGKPTTDTALKVLTDEVASLKRELQDEREAKKTSAADQEKQEAVDGFKSTIKTWIDEHKSECPIVASEGQVDLIYDVIEIHHQETGRVLDVADAAKHVEEYLRPQREATWKALGLSPSDDPPPTDTKDPKPGEPTERKAEPAAEELKASRTPRTLTNNQNAVSTPPVEQQLSDEESIARAAEKLRFVND